MNCPYCAAITTRKRTRENSTRLHNILVPPLSLYLQSTNWHTLQLP